MDDLKAEAPELADASSRLVRGGAHEAFTAEIEAHARDPEATLVVLGSHGVSGFRQAALGSVTSDLLRTLESDILVISTKSANCELS